MHFIIWLFILKKKAQRILIKYRNLLFPKEVVAELERIYMKTLKKHQEKNLEKK